MTEFEILELARKIVDGNRETKRRQAEDIVDKLLDLIRNNWRSEYDNAVEHVKKYYYHLNESDFSDRMFKKFLIIEKALSAIAGESMVVDEYVDYALEHVSIAYNLLEKLTIGGE